MIEEEKPTAAGIRLTTPDSQTHHHKSLHNIPFIQTNFTIVKQLRERKLSWLICDVDKKRNEQEKDTLTLLFQSAYLSCERWEKRLPIRAYMFSALGCCCSAGCGYHGNLLQPLLDNDGISYSCVSAVHKIDDLVDPS